MHLDAAHIPMLSAVKVPMATVFYISSRDLANTKEAAKPQLVVNSDAYLNVCLFRLLFYNCSRG